RSLPSNATYPARRGSSRDYSLEVDTWRPTSHSACFMRAYRLLEFRLAGGPDWVNTERYDIVGLVPGTATADDITPRLQSLLADRFKLTTHMEKREMPVLWLVLANKDGRLGPKFHRSTADCRCSPYGQRTYRMS